jgi:hypothetical protein
MMDEFLIHFLNELGAHLFFAKNFFLFVETLAKGLGDIKSGSMSSSVTMMTWLAFWNGIAHYFFGLYDKKSERSFSALFAHLDRHPELIPSSKFGYYQALSSRVRVRCQGRTLSPSDMEQLFDDVVDAHEIYVGFCNLFDIRGGSQNLYLAEKARMNLGN